MYHLGGIDVILMIDWLSKNHAIIDCEKKNVYLSWESKNEVNRLHFNATKYLRDIKDF